MPLVKIWACKGKSEEHYRGIIEGIGEAMTGALGIPESNMIAALHEMEPSRFRRIRGTTENFTMIEITLFPGRDAEAKKRLYQAIAGNLKRRPGIDGQDVVIVINESPKESWSVRDGLPASETGVAFIKDRKPA